VLWLQRFLLSSLNIDCQIDGLRKQEDTILHTLQCMQRCLNVRIKICVHAVITVVCTHIKINKEH
jgi:hypothetical protein